MQDHAPYSIPEEPGRWRAITLAATVHIVLIIFLWLGVQWQSQKPIAIEAEIWSPQIREAAPIPPSKPISKPKSELTTKTAPPPPKVIEPPLRPEIALEREKRRKEQEHKERIRQEQVRLEKQRQQQKEAEEHKLKEVEANKAAQEKAARKAEADAKKKQAAIEAAADKKHRAEDLDRMMRQAAGINSTDNTSTATQSQGPRGNPEYAQKVGAKIKSNINFNVPDGMTGNPSVQYEVQLLPDGTVAGLRLTKSSGIAGFDEAVRRAIEKSQPYPKDN